MTWNNFNMMFFNITLGPCLWPVLGHDEVVRWKGSFRTSSNGVS